MKKSPKCNSIIQRTVRTVQIYKFHDKYDTLIQVLKNTQMKFPTRILHCLDIFKFNKFSFYVILMLCLKM